MILPGGQSAQTHCSIRLEKNDLRKSFKARLSLEAPMD